MSLGLSRMSRSQRMYKKGSRKPHPFPSYFYFIREFQALTSLNTNPTFENPTTQACHSEETTSRTPFPAIISHIPDVRKFKMCTPTEEERDPNYPGGATVEVGIGGGLRPYEQIKKLNNILTISHLVNVEMKLSGQDFEGCTCVPITKTSNYCWKKHPGLMEWPGGRPRLGSKPKLLHFIVKMQPTIKGENGKTCICPLAEIRVDNGEALRGCDEVILGGKKHLQFINFFNIHHQYRALQEDYAEGKKETFELAIQLDETIEGEECNFCGDDEVREKWKKNMSAFFMDSSSSEEE
ncbi:hypothetical protein P280DRAFT_521267 [Massarina eburnea CBS 473.64]|uniref:Uncharacterized protein n=1 Tax=Massarina eburnea CBS 473.64 TaxID=1395130 RepID=A0A6A6RSI3_9PLEO|nr:hypothetical protein P280DRAFT_521267 [Massarina eburnea CBS 473.64]